MKWMRTSAGGMDEIVRLGMQLKLSGQLQVVTTLHRENPIVRKIKKNDGRCLREHLLQRKNRCYSTNSSQGRNDNDFE